MKGSEISQVIVADDNRNSLMHIGLLLKRLGYNVVPAKNGLEVLRLLKFVEPDVVMLDVGMETVDGMAVLKSIKENVQTSDIPVIMVSGDSSAETIRQCKELGCIDYITKPVSSDKLHNALEWCSRSESWTRRRGGPH